MEYAKIVEELTKEKPSNLRVISLQGAFSGQKAGYCPEVLMNSVAYPKLKIISVNGMHVRTEEDREREEGEEEGVNISSG